MTILPIVGRELRVASRRRGTHLGRLASASVAVLLFAIVFVAQWGAPPRALGTALFHVLSGCFLVVSLMVGVVSTADALSEERREGTLGLLFLTDLRGYDVVLGKLAASSLGAVYGLLAMLPILGFPLLLGGVTGGEWWRFVLLMLHATFLSLAVGLMASAIVQRTAGAMALTLFLMAGLTLAGPCFALWLSLRYHLGAAPQEVLFTSLAWGMELARDSGFAQQGKWYWGCLGWSQLVAWLALIYATVRVRHGWREGSAGNVTPWRERWRRWLLGSATQREAVRRRWLEASPCSWLGGRHRLKPRAVWLLVATAVAAWLVGAVNFGWEWMAEGYGWMLVAVPLHAVLRWWLAVEAVQTLGPDRRSGALELILTTPLPAEEVVRGRLLGLRGLFFWPTALVVALDYCLIVLASGGNVSESRELGWVTLVLVLVLVLDMGALAHLGMWWGLVTRQARWAILRTLLVVFGLPWAAYICLFILLSLPAFRTFSWGFGFTLWSYALLNLAVSGFVLFWARVRLFRRLRVEAGGDPEAGKGAVAASKDG